MQAIAVYYYLLQFPVCPSVPQQFPVMVLEDSSTSQHAPVHHSMPQYITACPSTSQQLPPSHSMSENCCNLLEEYVRFCRQDVCCTGTRQVATSPITIAAQLISQLRCSTRFTLGTKGLGGRRHQGRRRLF